MTQRAEATHYFLYEFVDEDGDSTACCIEFASDSFELPDPEFEEVTLTMLHAMGHLTASEQFANASAASADTNYETSGIASRMAMSWIVFWRDGAALHCYRGSLTSTSIVEKVKVIGRYRKYLGAQLRSERTASGSDLNGPEVRVWWHTKHNPPRYYRWNQHGWHWWADIQPGVETDVWATELQ